MASLFDAEQQRESLEISQSANPSTDHIVDASHVDDAAGPSSPRRLARRPGNSPGRLARDDPDSRPMSLMADEEVYFQDDHGSDAGADDARELDLLDLGIIEDSAHHRGVSAVDVDAGADDTHFQPGVDDHTSTSAGAQDDLRAAHGGAHHRGVRAGRPSTAARRAASGLLTGRAAAPGGIFDFAALEDYATHEREGLPIPAARRRRQQQQQHVHQRPSQQRSQVSADDNGLLSPPEYGMSASPGRKYGVTPGVGSGVRHRKLSENHTAGHSHGSGAPGRHQRKLALFEGSAGDEGGLTGPPSRGALTSSALDAKTPLLGDKYGGGAGGGANGGSAGVYGSAGNGPLGGAGAGGAGASGPRPYRFAFYSNALPSTIHARSLAEIPGENQTFEELFKGRKEADTSSSDDGDGDDFDAADEETGTRTGPSIRGTTSAAPGPVTAAQAMSGIGMSLQGSSGSQLGTGRNTPSNQETSHSARESLSSRFAVPITQLNGRQSARDSPRVAQGAEQPPPVQQQQQQQQRHALMRQDAEIEANTWWLDVLCPTDQEMKILSKVFGIHPLTTEDIQMEETREKIELFRNYYFVCFRSFEQDPYSPTYLEPLNMYIIVFREGTLSFHFRGTPHPQNVRRRIKQLKDYINVTSDWISYALIDDITDAFGPLIQSIEYEVDSIDELVLILKEAEQSDMLRRIGTCRKKVMGLLRLMGNKADVVKGLSKRCNEHWSVAPKSDIGLYLSDIQDHITTSTQNLTHYEKILSRSHSNYLAQISIVMTDANNQINDILSKLTALGTVLIPMNLITGLWGMNVKVPGQEVDNLAWFFGIVGCLAAIALAGAYVTYKLLILPPR